jgi:Mg2+ and Co2+ transporter CorA
MNMPQVASTSLHGPSTPTVVRLVDTAGHDGPATPRETVGQLQAGAFFWLDLEAPGDDELAEFSQSLRLPADTIVSLVHTSARSSFAPAIDSVQAVLPAAVDTKPTAWLEANYVTVVLTKRFLLTVHIAPCAPLQHARHQYHALDDEDAKADPARVLFLVLDVLIGSFRSQLLALDDRLGEIQLDMLRGTSPKVHDELVQILGVLTDGIQELGWYSHDLEEIAETVDRLPGMRPGAQQHFDRHCQRVAQMRENGNDIREEARDALSHYSEFVAGRQAQVINSLTIVATVFLPLSFLTGYFGMNFRTLTAHVQNTLWEFILLGLLLPIVSVALSLLLIHRLQRRFGIRRVGQRPS